MPIYLLRHGESEHNVQIKGYMDKNPETHVMEWYEIEDSYDPNIRDANLTPLGITQAQDMVHQVATLNPSLLLMSPLRRNLATGQAACHALLTGGHDSHTDRLLEVAITPDLREHTYATCDIGTDSATLALTYPHWSKQLEKLPKSWWEHNNDQKDSTCSNKESTRPWQEPWQDLQNRADAIISLITEETKKHECILVVGHAVLFYAMTGEWMSNCELMELDLSKLRSRCSCQGNYCCCESP
jgi:broad specificity phosphatase PhoE